MTKRKIVKPPRKKADSDSKPKDAPQTDNHIIRGIWGLVYFATGLLFLISILFYSPKQLTGGANGHVLGAFIGTRLALGLAYIFGSVAAFMFSASVCYIGAVKLLNRPPRLKLLLFAAVLMIELCLLLAIGYMPELVKPIADGGGLKAVADNIGSNYIGLFMVNALSPLFGGRVFGPYFIVSLLVAITLIVGLRVRTEAVIAFASKWFIAMAAWLKTTFIDIWKVIRDSPDILPKSTRGDDDNQRKDKKTSNTKKEHAVEPPIETGVPTVCADSNITVTDAAIDNASAPLDTNDNTGDKEPPAEEAWEKSLESERVEWKKNKDKGIQILTVETPDIEIEPTDDETLIPILDNGDQDYDVIEDIEADETTEFSKNDIDEALAATELPKPIKPYELPSPDVIQDPPQHSNMINKETIEKTAALLEKTLMHFKVEGKVVAVSPGPVVTRYEIVLAPGIKVSKVTSLQDDLLMAAGAEAIRIQAPIPGKSAVGIELPNETRQNVHFKHILLSSEFKKNFALPAIIGSNISGIPYVTDITKTPHLLVAGQTGSGKSVCMNSLICTMLMTKKPEELRLIMIDPKQVEFASFQNIPHLLAPVVTESKEAVKALQWGVIEMERRYKLLTAAGVRKLDDFNTKLESGKLAGILPEEDHKPLPLIVIIIDELADLMMTAPKDVEGLIARITQKARAAGIHMIVATQRPSVNVITGLIKANLPSRIAFRTVSSVDSRTILDQGGSEKLLGMGDMLFLRNGAQNVERFHGAFIPDDDVEAIVAVIKAQEVELEKINSFHDVIEDPDDGGDGNGNDGGGPRDSLFAEAARITVSIGQGSTSLLQRRMNIGFARAGRIMDQLEHAGIVGPSKGSKTREVLIMPEELESML